MRPSRSDQAPATEPSTRYVPTENGFFVREDARPEWLRQEPRPPRVDEQIGVPVRQEPDRAGVSGSGQRCVRQVDQLSTLLVAEPPQVEARRRPSSRRSRRDARPRRDLAPASPDRTRAGTPGRGASVPPPRSRPVGRPNPRRARGGPPCRRSQVPDGGTRTRSTHRPRVPTKPLAQVAELLHGPRTVEQGRRAAPSAERSISASGVPVAPAERPAPLLPPCLPDAQRIAPVLASRNDVDRHPHQRRLDHRPVLEGVGQRVATEGRETRPQPDIARRGVLGLEAADLLDRLRDGQRCPLEQQLAREQGAVQRRHAEDRFGHRR